MGTHLRGLHHGHHRVRVGIWVRGKTRGESGRVLEGHNGGGRGDWNLVLSGNTAACVCGGKLVYLGVFSGGGKSLLLEEDELPESVGKDQRVDLEVNEEEGKDHDNNGQEDEYSVVLLIIGIGTCGDIERSFRGRYRGLRGNGGNRRRLRGGGRGTAASTEEGADYIELAVVCVFSRRRGIIFIVSVSNNRECGNKGKHESNDHECNTDGNVGTQTSWVLLVSSHKTK